MTHLIVAVIVGFATAQLGLLCTTVYLHRTVAHRAVTLSPAVTIIFRTLVWVSSGIRPRQWAAVHRRHHAFTDIPGDPHSPIILSYWRVQLGNANLYRKCARDGVTVKQYAKDLPPDRLDRWVFDHGFVGLFIGLGILIGALGWEYGLIAAGVHVVAYLGLNAAINAIGHSFGRQPYVNTARNNQWLALLTFGEGLHNNHHAAPTTARLAHKSWEIDPGWWLITVLQKQKLAKVRLTEPRLVSEVAKEVVSVS